MSNDLQKNFQFKEIHLELEKTKSASQGLRTLSTEIKNKVLLELSGLILKCSDEILIENKKDIESCDPLAPDAFKDRLLLNSERLKSMSESLKAVAALSDPVGEIVEEKKIQSTVIAKKCRSPLGVIFMIFESRPNVAIEAFSLAFKSGNAIILRGGKESKFTVSVFYQLIQKSLQKFNCSPSLLLGITDPDREIVNDLLTQKKWIDVVVPRGGDKLIEYVTIHSQIPIIKNDRGLCHLFVDESANLDMALALFKNGKTQRPGVCNALETVLIQERHAEDFLKKMILNHPEVEFYCDELLLKNTVEHYFQNQIPKNLKRATSESFDTEYLDLKVSVKSVKNLEEALKHIEKHGSKHSECIVTENREHARRFQNEVDAACVYWNASTRFTDGFQLGLGGELGISTQKLHVRGPVGLKELTSLKWIFDGSGECRQ